MCLSLFLGTPQVSVLLCGNTIPSLINIHLRLIEFAETQRRATKRALGALFPLRDGHQKVFRSSSGSSASNFGSELSAVGKEFSCEKKEHYEGDHVGGSFLWHT